MLCCIVIIHGNRIVVHFDGAYVQRHHPINVAVFLCPSASQSHGRRSYRLVYSIDGGTARSRSSCAVNAGPPGRDGSSRSRCVAD